MSKFIITFFVLLTAHKTCGSEYFFCKDLNPSFKDDHYLIEQKGISRWRCGQLWLNLNFKNPNHEIFRTITWAEPLINKAKLWASYVPEKYNEAFDATLSIRHDVLIWRTSLSCKKVYRLIGRPKSSPNITR